ncbi:hypothetical protein PF005_g22610 [Phytophthora fragariae]|uniref:Retrotransposon gag domain-containing protein n=2 Tax=Phytophthora fragariae TaxID=53985 RepID=A0A6A3WE44_9STRA|nr:hypothetical protein PF009_g23441 [Phytophthora fragariae]KAE8983184.1 hypothetical protein PF011_g21299 [Phytophthora fragariae]KAE9081435.1 hypothetical protein PF007_g22658 [Phytophthora fragariae]KAE9106265.1 hypothetical protein PF006_g21406 [Phytophthora fragariae]KAE9182110.1 hypothetical protein PF005_g22610 [Phytophthora fragariae]
MVPATPVKSSEMFAEASVRSKISFVATSTVEMEECSTSYNSVFESSDAKDPEEGDDWKASGVMAETPEVTVVSAGRSSEGRPGMHDTPEESSESDDDRLGPNYHVGDLTREWTREVRKLSAVDNDSTPPRLKFATYLPLNSIEPFYGTPNQSEKSMQWLRSFVFGMKGTHKPPNTWCVAFELSLHDGAQYWYRQLPRKAKRTWTLLSQAFIKYYCVEFTRSAEARYYSAKRDG